MQAAFDSGEKEIGTQIKYRKEALEDSQYKDCISEIAEKIIR